MSEKREDYINWDEYFIGVAKLSAKRSKDPNTQVGACIVSEDNKILSMGYNGFPRGCSDEEFPWGKDLEISDPYNAKYLYSTHSELNAILNYRGGSLEGSKIYVTLFPCNECAKAIIQAGIKTIIYEDDKYADSPSVRASKRMLNAAGVRYYENRDNGMTDSRLQNILDKLDKAYGTEKKMYLEYNTPWQLLFATILSAQCTDARVNIVTRDLYKKYDSLEKFASASIVEMERDIHSIGFYHNKAKNLIACARKLLSDFNGEVPSDLDSLLTLPGVGRKTANVIRGNIFDMPSIVVDTHVKRITKKLGLTESEDPVKIEFELMEILPKDHWILWNTDLITLGRTICIARREKCDICFLREECPSAKV